MASVEHSRSTLRLDDTVRELRQLRAKGLERVHDLDAPMLTSCVSALTGGRSTDLQAHHYEIALSTAIDEMGDGDAADTAAILLGIASHVRGLHPIELRKRAAEVSYDRTADTSTVDAFRKTREPRILTAVATALLRATSEAASPRPQNIDETADRSVVDIAITGSDWRTRHLPVMPIGGTPPGRIRELTWSEFGAGIDQIREQIRDYGTSLDIDLAIGINEGGLLMATLLSSSCFGRCGIAYVRTIRHGSHAAIDSQHVALGSQLTSASAIVLCDFEVKTAPVLDMITTYLSGQGLNPQTPAYLATMGLLAFEHPEPPSDAGPYDVGDLACADALKSGSLTDFFAGYLMASPGIDPPLGLR